MQILVSDPSYDHEDEVDRPTFLADFESALNDLGGTVTLEDSDVGLGASEPVIIATLAGIFLLGKPINDNLDGWIGLAKKFGKLIKWTVGKAISKRIDENGANLLATKAILDHTNSPVESLELLSSTYIPFWTNSLRPPGNIDHHPDGLFTQTFVLNRDRVYVLVIKSNAVVESISSYPILDWYQFR